MSFVVPDSAFSDQEDLTETTRQIFVPQSAIVSIGHRSRSSRDKYLISPDLAEVVITAITFKIF